MSTRSLTHVYDSDNHRTKKPILTFYRQMDGYPSGHGEELAKFLKPIKVTNGISLNNAGKKIANGGGCLAAQLLAHFKNKAGVGGIYVMEPGAKDCGEEYVYDVIAGYYKPIALKVYRANITNGRKHLIWSGSPDEFTENFINKLDSVE